MSGTGELDKEPDIASFGCGYAVGAMFAKFGLGDEIQPKMSPRAEAAARRCVADATAQPVGTASERSPKLTLWNLTFDGNTRECRALVAPSHLAIPSLLEVRHGTACSMADEGDHLLVSCGKSIEVILFNQLDCKSWLKSPLTDAERGTQHDARGAGAWDSWSAVWESAVVVTGTLGNDADVDTGYTVELAMPWSAWGVPVPAPGTGWGLDLAVNDLAGGVRDAAVWQNTDGGTSNDPDGWGELVFAGACAPGCASACGGEADGYGGTCPLNDGAACAGDGNPCTDDACSGGACTHVASSSCGGSDGGLLGGDGDAPPGGDADPAIGTAPACGCIGAADEAVLFACLVAGLLARRRRYT